MFVYVLNKRTIIRVLAALLAVGLAAALLIVFLSGRSGPASGADPIEPPAQTGRASGISDASNDPVFLIPNGASEENPEDAEDVLHELETPLPLVTSLQPPATALPGAPLTQETPKPTAPPKQPGRLMPIHKVNQAAGKKQIAVTFDAAWGQEQILPLLDILENNNIRSTFFIVGFWAEQYSDLVRAITSRGHELGNHSTNHLHMTQLSREQIEADLRANTQKLFTLTGQTTRLFRPPFGEYNDLVCRVAQEQGMTSVVWSLDGMDWDGKSAEEITRRVTKKAQAGDIILFHVNQPAVVEALPDVLSYLSSNGFEITPLSQMLLTGATVVDKHGVQKSAG